MECDGLSNRCPECECDDHVIDIGTWDRICRGCGIVSCPEEELETAYIQFTDVPRDIYRNHFNSIMKLYAPSSKKLQQCHMNEIYVVFKRLVGRFMETKHLHGRKKMNYRVFIRKIMMDLGMEELIPPTMKLPKGKKTREQLEVLWKILNS